jgi:hypothetical protein
MRQLFENLTNEVSFHLDAGFDLNNWRYRFPPMGSTETMTHFPPHIWLRPTTQITISQTDEAHRRVSEVDYGNSNEPCGSMLKA